MKLLLLQLKNILRYVNRYVVLGVMVFLVCAVCLVAFKAYDMAQRAYTQVGMEMGSEMELWRNDAFTPSWEEYETVKALGYVEEIEVSKYVEYLLRPHIHIANREDALPIKGAMDFNVVGYLREEDKAAVALTAGRYAMADDECVVLDGDHIFFDEEAGHVGGRFALGDEIVIENLSGDKATHTLTVVGLAVPPNPEDVTPEGLLHDGFIYTTYEGAVGFNHENSGRLTVKHGDELMEAGYDATLRLYDYNDAFVFQQKVEAIATSDTYVQTMDLYMPLYTVMFVHPEYLSLRGPFMQLEALSLLALAISAIVSVVVVVAMTFMILNERRYDIGVLRCVGMSKGRIVLNMCAELFVFFLGVIVFSLLSGYWLADKVIALLPLGMSLDVSGGGLLAFLGIAWKMLAVGLGFTALASGLSMVYILRFQPMKILINRN